METNQVLDQLAAGGVAELHVVQMNGKPARLHIYASKAWGSDSDEIAISVEGQGLIIIPPHKSINPFIFLTAGFDMTISADLAQLLSSVREHAKLIPHGENETSREDSPETK